MGSEIEIKARCADPEGVRRKLVQCGARKVKSGREGNVCFDTPDGALHSADSLLRLREYGGAVLTFKGPRAQSAHPVKVRTEVEVEVGDFKAMSELLTEAGFVKAWAYEKEREEWELEQTKVCLDRLPGIGYYVEVEGKSEDQVRRVLGKLGIAEGEATSRTYAEIWRDFAKRADGRVPDMVFDDEEGK